MTRILTAFALAAAIATATTAQQPAPPTTAEYQAVLAAKGREPEATRVSSLVAIYERERQVGYGDPIAAEFRERLELADQAARSVEISGLSPADRLWSEQLTGIAAAELAVAKMTPRTSEWYAAILWASVGFAPSELHEAALVELRRLQRELVTVGRAAGLSGTFDEIATAVNNSPRCAPIQQNDVAPRFRQIMAAVTAALPKLFGRIPTIPYEVETRTTLRSAGDFRPGSLVPPKPGRVLFEAPVANGCGFFNVSLHEVLPGHLMAQHIAIEAQLPAAAQKPGIWALAFDEGWANYSVDLADEMGLPFDPYQRIARLEGEIRNAVRAAVDTGMQTKGWSPEQAKDFIVRNSPSATDKEIQQEISDSTRFPGTRNAAYLAGKLRFDELRPCARHARDSFR